MGGIASGAFMIFSYYDTPLYLVDGGFGRPKGWKACVHSSVVAGSFTLCVVYGVFH